MLSASLVALTMLVSVNPASCGANEDDNELAGLINAAPALFSGYVAGVTVLDCKRDAKARVELLRSLQANDDSTSSVLDLDQTLRRIPDISWAKGREDKYLPADAHRQLFVLELDCPAAQEFLDFAQENLLLSAPYKWLILQKFSDETIFFYSGVDSEVILWNLETNGLSAVYRRNKDQDLELEHRGTWISGRVDLQGVDKNATARRRKNLRGLELKSSLVITNPKTLGRITEYRDPQIDTIAKCSYPWAHHMIQMLNATVSFEVTNSWGYPTANGTWDGMIGMLQRGEIDFGGVGSFISKERFDVVHFMPLTTDAGSRFIFRQPSLSSVSNLFRLPFDNSVWLVCGALLILLVAMLYPAMRLEWLRYRNEISEPYPPNLSDDLLVVMGAVSQQGSWYEPRSLTTRIIVLIGLVAALNLYAAYAANIVALLQSTTSSISTLKDLLDSHLSLGVHNNVYNRHYFRAFKDPVRRAIYEEKVENSRKSNWFELNEGIERLRNDPQFAFHVEKYSGYKVIQNTFEEVEKCGFQEINYLNMYGPHTPIQKRSPYLEMFKIAGLRIRETGLRAREINKWYTKKPVCGSARRFVSVGLTECYGAFLTLLIGFLITFGVFVAEFLKTKFYADFRRALMKL